MSSIYVFLQNSRKIIGNCFKSKNTAMAANSTLQHDWLELLHKHEQLEQKVNTMQHEYLEKLVKDQIIQKSDLAAIKNRIVSTELLKKKIDYLEQKSLKTNEQILHIEENIEDLSAVNKDQYEEANLLYKELSSSLEQKLDDLSSINKIQYEEANLLYKEVSSSLEQKSLNFITQIEELKFKYQNSKSLRISNFPHGLLINVPGDLISDHIHKGLIWDEHIFEVAKEASIRNMNGIAIDIGANLGTTTIGLSELFKKVISFEPNDFSYRMLTASIILNNIKNIVAYNIPLYSCNTELSLGKQEIQEVALPINKDGDFDGLISDNLAAYIFCETGSGIFKHSANTLDSYKLENVAFIKIDAQGCDGRIIMGALNTIKQSKPYIVFEWEENLSTTFNVSLESIVESLSSLGYEVSILKAHNEKQIDYVARPKTKE